MLLNNRVTMRILSLVTSTSNYKATWNVHQSSAQIPPCCGGENDLLFSLYTCIDETINNNTGGGLGVRRGTRAQCAGRFVTSEEHVGTTCTKHTDNRSEL